uniref:Carboxylic ester hydrolase n=1 Tax=Esox lucius TaxID=8010 RepID=A0A6Q2X5C2_ESOLU
MWLSPFVFTVFPAETGPVVSLKSGKVRGKYISVKGIEQRVQQYLGIPFARPPLGPLRLAAPQPVEPWEGEWDGTRQPHMCIQDPIIAQNIVKAMAIECNLPDVSEDCLYLNVYTPKEAATGEKLPVFFWIHGGGLSMGAASQYDASPLAAYQNMVVVVIQYRLGILGFLSTGDKHATGNWGFLDQIAALKWVQENIERFGGDPLSVTIAGESAGGISASILTMSPLAKGLFNRAIFQSGVATLDTYTTKDPLSQAMVVANLAECDNTTNEQLVKCLREKTKEELVNTTRKMKINMGATVDGVFLKDEVEKLLKRKEFQKVPVLLGVTNHEFGWILPSASSLANSYIIIIHLLKVLVIISNVSPVCSDADAPVYLYEFQHRPEMHKDTRPSFVKSDHADDIGFMFGSCFWNGHIKITGTITEEEKTLCKTMMAYWANFARTGSPNGEGLVQWPLYDQKEEYMELGLKQVVSQGLKKDKVKRKPLSKNLENS